MTNGQLVGNILKRAIAYRKAGVSDSLRRNSHMHDFNGEFDQSLADAVLTDFVNYCAMQQCMDLALYAKDLTDPEAEKVAKQLQESVATDLFGD